MGGAESSVGPEPEKSSNISSKTESAKLRDTNASVAEKIDRIFDKKGTKMPLKKVMELLGEKNGRGQVYGEAMNIFKNSGKYLVQKVMHNKSFIIIRK